MIKMVSYLQGFDDVYSELRWNDEARNVLDAIKKEGRFIEELAFEIIEELHGEYTLSDLRKFVVNHLIYEVNYRLMILERLG